MIEPYDPYESKTITEEIDYPCGSTRRTAVLVRLTVRDGRYVVTCGYDSESFNSYRKARAHYDSIN